MSVFKGEHISVSIFGESHSRAIGTVIEGIPAGTIIDEAALRAFMQRRAPRASAYSTARRETDEVEIIAGAVGGVCCGSALTLLIRNTDAHSSDYDKLKYIPRPGHADYAAYLKYGEARDHRGGGQFSGRLTAPLCAAGAIFTQLLEKRGIVIGAHIRELGGICDDRTDMANIGAEALERVKKAEFPVFNADKGEQMQAAVSEAKNDGDSLGGIIECIAIGVPGGAGGELFDGIEGKMAQLIFAVPAIKGIEFGAGFSAARMRGSENNDTFIAGDGIIRTATNNHGGILGGMSSGMPIVFSAAVKPTPSVAREQDSVRLDTCEPVKLKIGGRHDSCIVPRAVPCIEAAAAVALYDLLA